MPDPRPILRIVSGHPRRSDTPQRDHVRLTSAADRREHRVRQDAYAVALHERTGECIARCGHAVVLVALATPPGRPCEHCAEAVPDERTW